MAATVNRIPVTGISVGQEVSALAERLRESVVRVGGVGPGSGSGVIWSADGLHRHQRPRYNVEHCVWNSRTDAAWRRSWWRVIRVATWLS